MSATPPRVIVTTAPRIRFSVLSNEATYHGPNDPFPPLWMPGGPIPGLTWREIILEPVTYRGKQIRAGYDAEWNVLAVSVPLGGDGSSLVAQLATRK